MVVSVPITKPSTAGFFNSSKCWDLRGTTRKQGIAPRLHQVCSRISDFFSTMTWPNRLWNPARNHSQKTVAPFDVMPLSSRAVALRCQAFEWGFQPPVRSSGWHHYLKLLLSLLQDKFLVFENNTVTSIYIYIDIARYAYDIFLGVSENCKPNKFVGLSVYPQLLY